MSQVRPLTRTTDSRQSAPLPIPCIALPRAAPRRAARGGGRNEDPPRSREKCLCTTPAHVHWPVQLFAAGSPLEAHTQPALRTGLMAPAWRLLHVSRRVTLDLTCRKLHAVRFETVPLSLHVAFGPSKIMRACDIVLIAKLGVQRVLIYLLYTTCSSLNCHNVPALGTYKPVPPLYHKTKKRQVLSLLLPF